MMSCKEKVRQFIADKLSVDLADVLPEAGFVEDLAADSLDLVELFLSAEERFKIQEIEFDFECLTPENKRPWPRTVEQLTTIVETLN